MRYSKLVFIGVLGAALGSAALAQTPGTDQRPQPPQQPNPEQTVPERISPRPIEPQQGAPRQDENLSERLDRTDGVIRPPADTGRTMPVITPPDTGTTPVIPPPPPNATPQR